MNLTLLLYSLLSSYTPSLLSLCWCLDADSCHGWWMLLPKGTSSKMFPCFLACTMHISQYSWVPLLNHPWKSPTSFVLIGLLPILSNTFMPYPITFTSSCWLLPPVLTSYWRVVLFSSLLSGPVPTQLLRTNPTCMATGKSNWFEARLLSEVYRLLPSIRSDQHLPLV